ncbi:hypothetical protein ACJ73_10106 [Blastomyces percursus]|uniref:Uncharacterized protein n=1 Tax=Blastomyces percursus TaxID=1658174 RepID=A0A1J9Q1C9_9EURO|nr:hypothetical protein ACJ73_10106 [Blastomyces percursus]
MRIRRGRIPAALTLQNETPSQYLPSLHSPASLLFPECPGPKSPSYDVTASVDDRSSHEKLKARAWKDRMAWERQGVRPQDVLRYRASYFKSILLAEGTIEMNDNEKAVIPGSRQRYCVFVGFIVIRGDYTLLNP